MIEENSTIRYIDLFCGIGGFRLAVEQVSQKLSVPVECVFSSDIDEECQKVYHGNFGEIPYGDITKKNAIEIPDHDILLAGFPCQPFSIIGKMKGFEDTRGTLFFDIARILEEKRPKAFILENVKLLRGHNKGKTFARIIEVITDMGYKVDWQILNALDFGLPQKRERVFIVGFREPCAFEWPKSTVLMKSLDELLEDYVPEEFFASEYIRNKRKAKRIKTQETAIWHENKSGHISAYPYSCALRAGASYNYLLVNGERRLTPREMLRLQGFPDAFKIISSYSQTRKQAGNALPVPVAKEVLLNIFVANNWDNLISCDEEFNYQAVNRQFTLLEKRSKYDAKPQT